MARKIFRWDIYRSHPTTKVAQYYFFTRDAWHFGGAGTWYFCVLPWIFPGFPKPAPYKQLCQIMTFYWMFGLPPLILKSQKYNLSQKHDLRSAYLNLLKLGHILSKEERRFVAEQDLGCQGWQTDRQSKTLTDPKGWGHSDKFIKRNRVPHPRVTER